MSKILYPKQAINFEEQINLLTKRGLIFNNKQQVIQDLTNFGYYRLSAYWYPYRIIRNEQVLNNFTPETNWDKIIGLYEFDSQLRLLMLDAIERVEVAIRAKITYEISCKYGKYGYLNKKNFHSNFNHADWCKKIKEVIENSKDVFIKHFFSKYEDKDPPIWMVTELISLGSLSQLYQGLKHEDKKIIASCFKIPHKTLKYWLHIITYVRNICAHYSRLWNRDLIIHERTKSKKILSPIPRNDRIFYVILILIYLMKHLNNSNDWQQQVNQLIAQFPDKNKLTAMGIPENWQEYPQ